jgi:hypothetical protein
VPVHGDACRGLQFFPVDCRQNSNIVVGSAGGGDESVVLIDHFDEVADHEWDCLDAFELLLRSQLLSAWGKKYRLSFI